MYLVDTHALLWFLNDDPALPDATKELIGASREVYASVVTFWEMAIKNSIGRLTLPDPISRIMAVCEEKHIAILPIKAMHLDLLCSLPAIHKDPFDRLLICQAKSEGMTLVTVDESIAKYDVATIWRK